jgi:CheY-like chemotaxis protein
VQESRRQGNYEPPAPSLDGFQLLVVDDEADAREFVTTVLEHYGAKVIAVASVSEALEAVERSQPDVLVSDIGMPGENGYSLIRKLRQLEAERGGRIPAIALTAYARSEDRAAAIAAGFQLHISKPVDPAQLAAVVANIVKRK